MERGTPGRHSGEEIGSISPAWLERGDTAEQGSRCPPPRAVPPASRGLDGGLRVGGGSFGGLHQQDGEAHVWTVFCPARRASGRRCACLRERRRRSGSTRMPSCSRLAIFGGVKPIIVLVAALEILKGGAVAHGYFSFTGRGRRPHAEHAGLRLGTATAVRARCTRLQMRTHPPLRRPSRTDLPHLAASSLRNLPKSARTGCRLGAEIGELFHHLRLGEGSLGGTGDGLEHVRRRLRRGNEAEPGGGIEAGPPASAMVAAPGTAGSAW